MASYQYLALSSLGSLLVFITVIKEAGSIGCFVCSSVNGSDPNCEDTFNSAATDYYKSHCMAGRAGHNGWFPGSACVKMKAELDDYRVVVRQCTVDDGGINSETEIGRESHCSMVNLVKFDGKYMKGCSMACDTDGCNTGNDVTLGRSVLIGSLCTAMFFAARWNRVRFW